MLLLTPRALTWTKLLAIAWTASATPRSTPIPGGRATADYMPAAINMPTDRLLITKESVD